MRTSMLLCALAWALGMFATPGSAREMRELSRPRQAPIIEPVVLDKLQTDERVRIWVFFTDKGVHTTSQLQRALQEATGTINPRALTRRARVGATSGILDLPVPERYVRAVARTGAEIRHVTRWFNGVSAAATTDQVRSIASLSFVASIDVLRGVPIERPAPDAFAPPDSKQPLDTGSPPAPRPFDFHGDAREQLDMIGVVEAHDLGYTGAGVLVAMFDSGFERTHPALVELPLVGEWDFVQGDGNTNDEDGGNPPDLPQDPGRCHGTATWSTAGGYLPGTMIGGAFGATFAIAKSEYGPYERHSEEDNWVAAMEWAEATIGADIISSSLGYRYGFEDGDDYTWEDMDGRTSIVAQAAYFADSYGILVVNSAGNDGPEEKTLISPSDSDSVLGVGAVGPTEYVTQFSSRGPAAPMYEGYSQRIKPDVMAQGSRVYGAISPGCYGSDEDDFFVGGLQGTSFSCPIVSGAAAILLEARPDLTPHDMRMILRRTASKDSPDATYGFGIVRLMDALYEDGVPMEPRSPMPFDVIEPFDFSATGETTEDLQPTFSWYATSPGRDGGDISYSIEIATSQNFLGDLIVMDGISDTSAVFDTPIEEEGFYYWRVKADDGGGFPRQSLRRNRMLRDIPPEPFDPIFPAVADTVDDTPFPTFTWEPSSDASPGDTLRYRLEVSTSSDFDAGLVYRFSNLEETTFTLPDTMPGWELFFHHWRVTAYDRFGAGTTTEPRTFLLGPFPPQPFDLLGPVAGDSVFTTRPQFFWSESVDPHPNDEVSYRFYLGTTLDAMEQIWAGTDTDYRVTSLNLIDTRTYYWQIRAVDLLSNVAVAGPDSFRVFLKPQPFSLEAPAPEDAVYDPTPTFSWNESTHDLQDEDVQYTLKIYADSLLSEVIMTIDDISKESFEIVEPLTEYQDYYWRVRATDSHDRSTWSSDALRFTLQPAPGAFALPINPYPNPYDPWQGALTVSYDVPVDMEDEPLEIAVHDITGRRIRVIESGKADVGAARFAEWDGRTASGYRVASGVYFIRVTIGGQEKVSRLVLVNGARS